VQLAADYARNHLPKKGAKGQVYLFDQVKLKGEDLRRSTRVIQGATVPVYAIHRTFGLDAVRNRIYRDLQHFPAGLTCDPTDEYSLLYHYVTSDRKPEGIWEEADNAPDHWFHADNFCSAAVLASFQEITTQMTFTSVQQKPPVRENPFHRR
jgi:hypothetical protein